MSDEKVKSKDFTREQLKKITIGHLIDNTGPHFVVTLPEEKQEIGDSSSSNADSTTESSEA